MTSLDLVLGGLPGDRRIELRLEDEQIAGRIDEHQLMAARQRVERLLFRESGSDDAARLAGQELFRALLPSEKMRSIYARALKSPGGGPCPLVLRFEAASAAQIPWEFLHDGEQFLALRSELLLVRCRPFWRLPVRVSTRTAPSAIIPIELWGKLSEPGKPTLLAITTALPRSGTHDASVDEALHLTRDDAEGVLLLRRYPGERAAAFVTAVSAMLESGEPMAIAVANARRQFAGGEDPRAALTPMLFLQGDPLADAVPLEDDRELGAIPSPAGPRTRASDASQQLADFFRLKNTERFVEAAALAQAMDATLRSRVDVLEQLALCLNRIAETQQQIHNAKQARQFRSRALGALEAIPEPLRRGETLGIAGRLYKGLWQALEPREEAGPVARRALDEAIRVYQRGFELSLDPYPGVNAATLSLRRGRPADRERAQATAAQVRTVLGLRPAATDPESAYWRDATELEIAICLGEWSKAEELAKKVTEEARLPWWLDTTANNLKILSGASSLAEKERDRIGELRDRLESTLEGLRSRELVKAEDALYLPTAVRNDLLIPVLLRVSDPAWRPLSSVNCQVFGQLGDVVSAAAYAQELRKLDKDPRVLAVQASRAVPVPEAEAGEGAAQLPKQNGLDLRNVPDTCQGGRGALIAIVDAGIDVLHRAFRGAGGQSRILEVWDQRDPNPAPGQVETYGRVHTAADIARYIAKGAVEGTLGDRAEHGTRVASIAAGTPLPSFPGGVAPEASLLVVIPKIHAQANDPVSVGYSSGHTDALIYIRKFAEAHQMPVVVNVSLGMNAGAHDGKSLLEASFERFTESGRAPGFAVAKSAGNLGASAAHAMFDVFQGAKVSLRWKTVQPSSVDDVVELWFRQDTQLSFVLKNDGVTSDRVDWKVTRVTAQLPDGTAAMTYELSHSDNGLSRLRICIHRSAASSSWQLDVTAEAVGRDAIVHAWIERDDSPGPGVLFTSQVEPRYSLTVPGTAPSVITVGAVAFDTVEGLSEMDSCSKGPTRDGREKPDLAAPGKDVHGALAGSGDGFGAGTGTSFAAPFVTGAIALLYGHCAVLRARQGATPDGVRMPSANQIAEALAISSGGRQWHPTLGNGVLDLQRFLGRFSE